MSARYTKEQAAKLSIIEKRVRTRPTKAEIQTRLELERLQERAKIKAAGYFGKFSNIGKRESNSIRLDLKPMSVNLAWQGKRFKSKKYVAYSRSVLAMLPKLRMPERPYKISYEFGFSNPASDLDNPVKPLQDLICKKYGFDDRHIFEINIRKVIVRKGCEYVSFRIETL